MVSGNSDEKKPILVSWSGGKDSAMALYELLRSRQYEVIGLIATICEESEYVAMHHVPSHFLESQAEALGLPIEMLPLPRKCSNETYCDRLNAVLSRYRSQGVTSVAFGDLYLDDLRDFKEENLQKVDMEAVFPLWHRQTNELSYSIIRAGFKAVVTCVASQSLGIEFVGRNYDRNFLSDLPITVDPCGENGEFHTFVHNGPIFSKPIPAKVSHKIPGEPFHFCELMAQTNCSRRSKRSS